MQQSWPLKLLPTSQQTEYWTQTTPGENSRLTASLPPPTLTYIHSFQAQQPLCADVFLFNFLQLLIPYFGKFVAPEESITLILSRWKEGLSSFSAWDWDLTANLPCFSALWRHSASGLDSVRAAGSSPFCCFVRVATWWLHYQEQCLGWCALRQARTTPEPASPWKVRKVSTCFQCLKFLVVTKLISRTLSAW